MKKILSLALICVLMLGLLVGCTTTPEETPATAPVESEAVETASDEATEEDSATVDTATLAALLEDDSVVVVDARPSAAFNGWTLAGEARNGHVEGAELFPATWIEKFENDEALVAELEAQGITKDKTIVTYGYETLGNVEAAVLAEKLTALGYENVKTYSDGIEVWAEDASLPMAYLENYQVLVYPELVDQLIKGEAVEGFEGKDVKIFECSWGGIDVAEDYKNGHVPTAVHINTDEFEEGPLWNRKSDADIEQAILDNGVTKDTVVIVYGADTTPASRVGLIMKYAGVEDVRLLDGGYQAWADSGLEVETTINEKQPIESFGVTVPANPDLIIDMEEARAILADENGRLCSIRSWVEYIGETSGYSYIEPKGRIDGAIYAYAGSDPWHMEDYRNIDNTMVNYGFMEARWAEQGITADTENSFYCGTGWRAAETWFYAYALGWENISLYDGGWYEWSSYPENPVAVGEPVE